MCVCACASPTHIWTKPSDHNTLDLHPPVHQSGHASYRLHTPHATRQALSNFALNGALMDSMSEMANLQIHGVAQDATAKFKMEKVMIAAKERGMTVPQIFKFFIDVDDENPDAAFDDEEQEVRAARAPRETPRHRSRARTPPTPRSHRLAPLARPRSRRCP